MTIQELLKKYKDGHVAAWNGGSMSLVIVDNQEVRSVLNSKGLRFVDFVNRQQGHLLVGRKVLSLEVPHAMWNEWVGTSTPMDKILPPILGGDSAVSREEFDKLKGIVGALENYLSVDFVPDDTNANRSKCRYTAVPRKG